jgi:putative hydrolase of the HAD superfamily
MPEITALFWDVGGVLLSKGWPTEARAEAARQFDLDAEELERRHRGVVADFEKGRLSLKAYLDRVVFHQPRSFGRDAFEGFMYSWSRPHPEALALAAELARSRRWLMATLNNESHELNQYRIERFGLRSSFAVFLSSCVLECRKPAAEIYRKALEITQRPPAECAFVDDQPENVEAARASGMRAIRFEGADQARAALRELGVALEA